MPTTPLHVQDHMAQQEAITLALMGMESKATTKLN